MDLFTLDPRLESSSHLVADWPLCQVRLKDDTRFPWLLLIPRRRDLVELTEMAGDDYAALNTEILRACHLLQTVARPKKLNVATLGNVVAQMHIHVIGRFASDPAWPDAVWGHGNGPAYRPAERAAMIEQLRAADAI
jgi:diadenosine tetraphosphate (Ap4A) HIT family hydrolase